MQTYVNPISGGQDPFVLKAPDGHYYSIFSGGNRFSSIYVSESEKLSEPGVAHLVWTAQEGQWNAGTIWAPEIHYLQGKYYIYYTSAVLDCGIEGWATRRLGVLRSENPLGPYEDCGKLELGEEMSIDGTVLEMPDGRLFFVYMRNRTFLERMNCLCIVPMESPIKISGTPVMISNPQFPWEEYVNEGPEALIHDGKVMIVYSAHAAHTPEYCLAILECVDQANPAAVTSWKKHTSPAFRKGNGVWGPGHAGMTVSADGSTPYLVYHSKSNMNGQFGAPGSMSRIVSVQPFGWTKDGLPDFGEPVPLGRPMSLPMGEKEDEIGTKVENAIQTENQCLIFYGKKEQQNIVENILYMESAECREYGCKAILRGLKWGDVSAAVDLRMPCGEGAGMLLRATNVGARRFMMQGYAVMLSPRFGLEILRMDGGEPIRLAYAPVCAKYGEWVRLECTCMGKNITARVGDTALTVSDDGYLEGRIGLAADETLGWFRNMKVEAR